MVTVDDVLKLLDRWPTWKKMTGLLARVDELEKRLAKLEGGYRTSQDFTEYDGALFKRNSNGSWQKAVYCPNCKTATSLFPGPIGGNMYTCFTCNWSSSFTDEEFPGVLQALEAEE